MHARTLPVLLVALLAAVASGCAAEQAPPGGAEAPSPETPIPETFESEAEYGQLRSSTEDALAEAIGSAEASDVGACRVVATSEQACGGPRAFAVYSTEGSDASEVERLAARLVALDVQANRQFEYVSTCVAYAPPTPAVEGGRCAAPE